jgi:hypothetical protein
MDFILCDSCLTWHHKSINTVFDVKYTDANHDIPKIYVIDKESHEQTFSCFPRDFINEFASPESSYVSSVSICPCCISRFISYKDLIGSESHENFKLAKLFLEGIYVKSKAFRYTYQANLLAPKKEQELEQIMINLNEGRLPIESELEFYERMYAYY